MIIKYVFVHFQWKILPKHSVLGCLRNFKMNGSAMLKPTTNHGAGPCFDGQLQSGAYFPGKHAHVVIGESESIGIIGFFFLSHSSESSYRYLTFLCSAEDNFVVGANFELLFDIRPRSLTGVLVHVGNFSRARHGASVGHHLSLYMLEGEVSCSLL